MDNLTVIGASSHRQALPFLSSSHERTMPFSHHSHSGQFCDHAKNTLEEVVQTAVSKRMDLYALTEHMPREDDDLYPEEVTRESTLHYSGAYDVLPDQVVTYCCNTCKAIR